jgi:hypothetical protein
MDLFHNIFAEDSFGVGTEKKIPCSSSSVYEKRKIEYCAGMEVVWKQSKPLATLCNH